MKIFKYLLRPIVHKVRQIFSTINLLEKFPTLKLGTTVNAANSVFGEHVYLASGVHVNNSELGSFTYCGVDTKLSNAKVGRFSCIGPNVTIGLGLHPIDKIATVHPAFYSTAAQVGKTFVQVQKFKERPPLTLIGSDVWIGAGVVIPGGITIGDGAVIATGAVVIKNVAAYEIVGGVPAKFIKHRFNSDTIEALLASKWWDWPLTEIEKHAEKFEDVVLFSEWANTHAKQQY